MEERRKSNKKKCRELVTKLDNFPAWKKLLKAHKAENVRFDVLSECHYKQALTLYCFQFSMYGGAINHACFDVSVEENLPRFKSVVQFAIRMGTSWVALDRKTNQVIGVGICRDVLDDKEAESLSNNPFSHIQKLRKQINNKALLSTPNHKLIFDGNLDPLSTVKYGEVNSFDAFVVSPMLKDQKIGYILVLVATLTSYYMGYSVLFTISTHPASIRITLAFTSPATYILFDYSTFKFVGNEKFKDMDDVYRALETESGYTKEYAAYLKKNSKVLVSFAFFSNNTWVKEFSTTIPEFKDVFAELFSSFSKL